MNLPLNLFDGNASVRAFLCQPDKTIIGEILPYEFNATFKFNTYSEISFTIDRYYNDLFDGGTKVNPYYGLVESLRVIYLQGIGHFSIQDVDENISDNESKSVTCFSLEYTTGQKYLENFYVNTGEEGSIEVMYNTQRHGVEYSIDNYYKVATNYSAYRRYYIKEYTSNNAYNYVEVQVFDENDFNSYDGSTTETTLYEVSYPNVQFYDPDRPELSLLHLVFSRIPEWKIGHVDRELYHQERTFSEDRVAVYDFLYNQAAETLKYVMVWDSINGVVNFYQTTEDGVTADNEVETQWNTDVFISKDNLVSAIDIKYSADDIKTKLKITGSDTLDVRDVNLGQNYILDLSYYIPEDTPSEWVGYRLQDKYNQYVNKLAVYTEQYKELISAWSAAYNEYSDLMNYVPVEPRVMLVGDEFDKLYCIYTKYRRTVTYDANATYYTYEKGRYTKVDPTPSKADIENDENYFYIENIDAQVTNLQTKLDTYRVDQEDDKTRSAIAKTDDVLLTLENSNMDSVTIRIRYATDNISDKPDKIFYRVYRTLTMAATGVSNTTEFTLYDWVAGNLTAKKLGLVDDEDKPIFKIKSIGTLGAYFCLVRDETNPAELEDYGIRLLEEKKDTYTKIFITQTEGYMNKEGSQCITSNELPKGNEYPDGTKWLDTDTVDSSGKLIMKIRSNGAWVDYTPDDNDYENYARFNENYTKLSNVQAVLAEKQRIADYLLNGVAITSRHITNKNINSDNLLAVAQDHFPNETLTLIEYNKNFGYITFRAGITPANGSYKSGVTYYSDIKGTIADPQPSVIQNEINAIAQEYNAVINGNVDYSKRPFISEEEMRKVYPEFEGEVATTYSQYETIGQDGDLYTIDITPILEDGTVLSQSALSEYICSLSTDTGMESILASDTNNLIIHIQPGDYNEEYWDQYQEQLDEIKQRHWELVKSFRNTVYYIAEEYAVYVNNGTPYVSYAHSQGLCLAKMNVIKEASDMNNPNNFSKEDLISLSPYIREDEYSDDNFLLTGYESEEEQMNIKQELLKAGDEELKKLRQPKLSFSTTMANMLVIPEFAPIKYQFKLGNFIRVGIRDGYVKRARLLEVQINFDDPSDFSATFGDLISTKSEIDKHADLLQQAVTAGKSVASNQGSWQRAVDKSTELDRRINDGLKDAALSVGSADGQSISWDSGGIWGRKLVEGTTDQYEPEQFRLINNKLVFSSDGFKTSKAVFGKYTVNGETRWGPLAEYITADMIEGKTLKGGSIQIGDEEKGNLFIVNTDGSVQIKTGGADKYASAAAITAIDSAYKYSVQIVNTEKAVFSSKDDKAILTAIIFRRGIDATEVFKSAGVTVYWEKNPSDVNWTPMYTNDGDSYSITLDSNNIQNSAQISCYIDPTEAQITEIESNYNN